jgi:mycothiol synthase
VATVRLARPDRLEPADVAAVLRIAAEVTAAVGAPPLSDHALLRLRADAGPGASHLLLRADEGVVGYAQHEAGEPASAELAVLPGDHAAARSGELVSALVDTSPDGLQIWVHGERSSLRRVLTDLDFVADRMLLQLRRSLRESLPDPVWPAGVTVRTFDVGVDEAEWLAVNNRAFASHPDQSGWTTADIRLREAEPWFDPVGFFLAVRDGGIVGFHWTKVHTEAEPIGEVYVVGVDPSMRGQRLGPALTLQGLHYLRDRGLPNVLLYVDESNTAAIRLYDELGFSRWDSDVRYCKHSP